MAEATLMITGGWKAKPPNVRWFASAALERREVVERPAGEPGARPLVSCGRTHPDMTLAIVDPGGARLLPPRHIGEVWVAGPSIGQGYWGRPEETAETFRARAAGSNQPFLRTADLGFILGGELFVTGRIKDLIIIGGLNHYPQDIEATVANSHPAIWPGGCVAFSVDEDGQERLAVVAAVDSREARSVAGACVTAGSQEGPGLAAEIRRAIRRAVAEEHEIQVAKLVLVKPGSIPKTSSGKLQRSECRARFRAGALEEWEP
jgi:acyl-CoA synthetase (AMP-forming)/AMP-acid ligase II